MWEFITALKEHLVLIVALITAMLALYNWVARPVKAMLERNEKQDADISMLLWDRLQQAHSYFMERGWASAAEKERLIAMHKAYQDRGRNHLSASFESDLLKLPERPPDRR